MVMPRLVMMKLPTWLSVTIISLVTLMASVNFFAPFFITSYEPNVPINGLFVAVVTIVFLDRRDKGGGGGGGGGVE
jgi:hypothetical protein